MTLEIISLEGGADVSQATESGQHEPSGQREMTVWRTQGKEGRAPSESPGTRARLGRAGKASKGHSMKGLACPRGLRMVEGHMHPLRDFQQSELV